MYQKRHERREEEKKRKVAIKTAIARRSGR